MSDRCRHLGTDCEQCGAEVSMEIDELHSEIARLRARVAELEARLASPADALPVVPLDEGDYFRARDQARRAPPAAHAGTPMQREAEASIALDRDQTHYVGDDCPGGHRDAHAGTKEDK